MKELKTGDIVYLKSGSPPMTVMTVHPITEKCIDVVYWGDEQVRMLCSLPLACVQETAPLII